MLWLLFLVFPAQETEAPAKVKIEDLKIISQRNIFSPARPKPPAKKKTPRKPEPKKTVKKAAPNPVIRGFVKFSDGYRVLVYDPATEKESYHVIGDKIQGAEIISVDLEKAILRVDGKDSPVFTASEIQRTDGSTMQGSTSGKKETPEKTSSGRSERLKKIREKMRKKYGKKVEEEVIE